MSKYEDFKDTDYADTAAVIGKIRLALDTDKFGTNEERLYALGFVLDRNKDCYINDLKRRLTILNKKFERAEKRAGDEEGRANDLQNQLDNLKEKVKKLEERAKEGNPQPAPGNPQKKVFVVRRKPTA